MVDEWLFVQGDARGTLKQKETWAEIGPTGPTLSSIGQDIQVRNPDCLEHHEVSNFASKTSPA